MLTQPTAAQRASLTSLTSKKRLKPYRQATNGHEGPALDLYLLDSQLASLLHGHLRQIEVVLREQINQALIAQYGQFWFHEEPQGSSTPAGLGNRCREMVESARESLRRDAGKRSSKSRQGTSPDKVIAELTMGFWAQLLAAPRDADHESTIWLAGVNKVFNREPGVEVAEWSRQDAMRVCQQMTWARNRVNHCESVVFGFPQKGIRPHGKQLRLSPQLILEHCRSLAGRFSPDLEQWMRKSTAADELMENPLVVKAWTQTESRRDVVTEKKAPKNLYTVGQALNRPSPQEDADV